MLAKLKNALVIYNLALSAILLTLTLVGVIVLGATVYSTISRLKDTPTSVPISTDTPTTTPDADLIARCREAFATGNTDTYNALECNKYGN